MDSCFENQGLLLIFLWYALVLDRNSGLRYSNPLSYTPIILTLTLFAYLTNITNLCSSNLPIVTFFKSFIFFVFETVSPCIP